MIEVLKRLIDAVEAIPENVEGWMPDVLTDALIDARQAIKELESQEPVTRYCCHSCFKTSGGVMLDRMIVCPDCGNKRCPKASNHALKCTNSNDPNQVGSIYTHPPQRTWVGLTDEERSQLVTLHHGWNEYGKAIEDELKQKNGYAEEKNT
jgi:DNA-directed RNA polymerase subunit RPC12/RpoP